MSEIGQLVVRFERDWEPRTYPYLGQSCLMGIADHLIEGRTCKRVVEFTEQFGSPEGQLKMDEILQGDGEAADRLSALAEWTPPPYWTMPEEGWRTARCLQAALESGGALSADALDIAGPLSCEVDDWLQLMDAAVSANIRFQVTMEPCPHPPADLVRFVQRDFDETAALIREALEKAGIEITDEDDGDT
jgi:hypothetical protein